MMCCALRAGSVDATQTDCLQPASVRLTMSYVTDECIATPKLFPGSGLRGGQLYSAIKATDSADHSKLKPSDNTDEGAIATL